LSLFGTIGNHCQIRYPSWRAAGGVPRNPTALFWATADSHWSRRADPPTISPDRMAMAKRQIGPCRRHSQFDHTTRDIGSGPRQRFGLKQGVAPEPQGRHGVEVFFFGEKRRSAPRIYPSLFFLFSNNHPLHPLWNATEISRLQSVLYALQLRLRLSETSAPYAITMAEFPRPWRYTTR